jgi:hypothetical protein
VSQSCARRGAGTGNPPAPAETPPSDNRIGESPRAGRHVQPLYSSRQSRPTYRVARLAESEPRVPRGPADGEDDTRGTGDSPPVCWRRLPVTRASQARARAHPRVTNWVPASRTAERSGPIPRPVCSPVWRTLPSPIQQRGDSLCAGTEPGLRRLRPATHVGDRRIEPAGRRRDGGCTGRG